jgi:OTU-like cysteine protease
MGIDITLYRLRIGCFSHRFSSKLRRHSSCFSGFSLRNVALPISCRVLALSIICAMLIIAGVEMNPGPTNNDVTTESVIDCSSNSFDDKKVLVADTSFSRHRSCVLCHAPVVGTNDNDLPIIIRCHSCSSVVHLWCLINYHKLNCGSPLKNNINWLYNFLVDCHFKYNCLCCTYFSNEDASIRYSNLAQGIDKNDSDSSMSTNSSSSSVISVNADKVYGSLDVIDMKCERLVKSLDSLDNKLNAISCILDKPLHTAKTYESVIIDLDKKNYESKSAYSIEDLRDQNVIIAHLPYCSDDSDMEYINYIIKDVLNVHVQVLGLCRIGNHRGRLPRLLRVTLSSREEANLLVSHSSYLQSSHDYVLRHIKISPDISPASRRLRSKSKPNHSFVSKTAHSRSPRSRLNKEVTISRPFTFYARATLRSDDDDASLPLPQPLASSQQAVKPTPRNSASASASNANERLPSPHTFQSQPSRYHGLRRFSAAVQRAAADGLHPVDVAGDGSCLFRAICRSDAGTEENHVELRAAAVSYMKDHASDFTEFGDIVPDENTSFEEYLRKISDPAHDVGEYVLNALCNVLHKNIKVYYADCDPRVYSPTSSDGLHTVSVNVIYKDLSASNNGHYMALVSSKPSFASSVSITHRKQSVEFLDDDSVELNVDTNVGNC